VLVFVIFIYSFDQNRKRHLSATLPKIITVIPQIAAWKFGRCLLASSHAGTRLPIADIQDSGRSPSVRRKAVSFLLSQKIKKKQENTQVVSSCNGAKSFPTAALSTSGIRVEGSTFLSACQNKLPCVFNCKIKTGDSRNGMPPVKNPRI